jgi:lipoprotein-anchoring transpeptidase ErfK/SrfK
MTATRRQRARLGLVGWVSLSLGSITLTSCPAGDGGGLISWESLVASQSQLAALLPGIRQPRDVESRKASVAAGQADSRTESVSAVSTRTEPVTAASAAAAENLETPVTNEPTEEDAERVLVSIGRETWIYAEPKSGARRLGYLRFGAVVGRANQPASREDCAQGWFRISPDGFACNNGRTATLDLEHKLVPIGRQRPDRLAGLPYVYGAPRGIAPPLYARLPTTDEQRGVEAAAVNAKLGREWQPYALQPVPNWLRQTANVFGFPREKGALLLGSTVPKSAFSLLGLFEDEGRAFGLTADLALVPLGRLRPIEPSRFHGLALDEQQGLPVVFVFNSHAGIFAGNPSEGKLTLARQANYRDAFSITGRKVIAMGSRWVELRSGEWLRDEKLLHVEAPANWPSWAVAGRTWVDVSIGSQTLVAYDGTKPVYVTLVSTGAAGLDDPHTTTATKRGTFQIHAKHVTATMDGNEPGHEFDLRDVPWVQYFTDGYALHAAYWHDDFGRPHSHGCVNLAPLDARWLFHFTAPAVPQSWHGVVAHKDTTIVNVHP